jgi:hypothetical protein
MARIAYLLLCHKDPGGIVRQVGELTAAGDRVAIHFDANAPAAQYAGLRDALSGNPGVTFTARRLRCGWGEWSLVAATLEAARAALAAFPDATHFYMLSGDCMPVKTAEYAHRLLDAEAADWIESHDFFASDWIRIGMREDRLHYRHWFNERRRKGLFYASLAAQKRLGLRRAPPADLDVMIGSQWWCLRRATLEAVLGFLAARPDVVRFFRTTWIPDEIFFQTLVRHLVPESQIRNRTLTFLMFTDYGMPVTFYNDHHDLLLRQDYLFARKISPEATELKARLGALYAARGVDFTVSNEGRALHAYVTSRGRDGRRFAPRFWEAGASLGRDRELLMIACKKWHVGRRLAGRISVALQVPALDYVFNEEGAGLPDLGGIETTLAKRTRHRRALLRMLFELHGSDRMILCLDPSSFDLIEDFASDRATTRLLRVECEMSDGYLAGHAGRVGLTAPGTAAGALGGLIATLRADIAAEAARLGDAGPAGQHRLREGAPEAENLRALAGFLGAGPETVATLFTPDLFAD